MSTPRMPPRFVPTLTDVVPAPPDLPPLPPPAPPPLPEAPPALQLLPIVLADEAAPAGGAPDAVTLAFPDGEEPLAQRLRELIEQRLQQALQAALQDLEPLMHEALAQLLADEAGRPRAAPGEDDRAGR